jgi:hypothetical protein
MEIFFEESLSPFRMCDMPGIGKLRLALFVLKKGRKPPQEQEPHMQRACERNVEINHSKYRAAAAAEDLPPA